MSSYYQRKGAGRSSKVEKELKSTIDSIIEAHNLDSSDWNVIDSVSDLQTLRDKLVDDHGLPGVSPTPEPTPEPTPTPDPVVSQNPTPEPTPEPSATPIASAEPATAPSTETSFLDLKLDDFVEVKAQHAFVDKFPEEDMYKLGSFFDDPPPPTPAPTAATPAPVATKTPNKWAERKAARQHAQLNPPTPTSPTTAAPATPAVPGSTPAAAAPSAAPAAELSDEEKQKVALKNKTAKKAAKSLARQSAKIFEFVLEFAVKKGSKISPKALEKLEKASKIDRHFPLDESGKTISQFIDDHNEVIDEIIKVDPDSRDDLVEAILLVAEEQDVKTSPMANLGMVVITIALTMAKAGYDQKKLTKRLIKKVSDNYTLQTKNLAAAHKENAELKEQLKSKTFNQAQPYVAPLTPAPTPSDDQVREISFGKPIHSAEPESIKTVAPIIPDIQTEIVGDDEAKRSFIKTKQN